MSISSTIRSHHTRMPSYGNDKHFGRARVKSACGQQRLGVRRRIARAREHSRAHSLPEVAAREYWTHDFVVFFIYFRRVDPVVFPVESTPLCQAVARERARVFELIRLLVWCTSIVDGVNVVSGACSQHRVRRLPRAVSIVSPNCSHLRSSRERSGCCLQVVNACNCFPLGAMTWPVYPQPLGRSASRGPNPPNTHAARAARFVGALEAGRQTLEAGRLVGRLNSD